MIVAKVLAVTAAVLALTVARDPRSQQPQFSVLGRRLWRFNHPPPALLPPLLSFQAVPRVSAALKPPGLPEPEGELDRDFNNDVKAPCSDDNNDIDIVPGPLPKKRPDHAIQFYTPRCVCPEQEGYYELEEGHFPRYVVGRKCTGHPQDGAINFFGFKSNCETNEVGQECCHPSAHCGQQMYPVRVLSRRTNQDDKYDLQGEDTIPTELNQNWIFKTFNISVACVLKPN